jgi:hypothetical protein
MSSTPLEEFKASCESAKQEMLLALFSQINTVFGFLMKSMSGMKNISKPLLPRSSRRGSGFRQ